jgi:hypothetical protein
MSRLETTQVDVLGMCCLILRIKKKEKRRTKSEVGNDLVLSTGEIYDRTTISKNDTELYKIVQML